MLDDKFMELLIRIDERVKGLDDRVDRIEKRLDTISFKNGWRERGILALLASTIVGLVELLKRLVGVG